MKGMNPARPRDRSDGERLQVAEVFLTIQGEGPFSGCPAVFVRLSGCNLRCHFCDTKWDDDGDQYIGVEDLIGRIIAEHPHPKLIVLTGGEPARQNLTPFAEAVEERFWDTTVQVETAGTFWQEAFAREDWEVVVSPKLPYVHPKLYVYAQHWKYVVAHTALIDHDGLPKTNTQRGAQIDRPLAKPPQGAEVWLSPMDEDDEATNQLNREMVTHLALKHGYRVSLQTHKILGVR